MYYGRSSDFESAEMTIDVVNDGAVSTGNVYPQPQRTGVLYNAYLIKPNFNVNEKLLYFFASTIQKSIKLKFGYENKAGWAKVKEEKISLPIRRDAICRDAMHCVSTEENSMHCVSTKGNRTNQETTNHFSVSEIDFDFMENFISQLEAYLLVTGLKDYTLTTAEKQALADFENGKVQWKEFKVVDLFEVKNTRNILSRDIVENSGETPYLSASRENNAVSSYISYDEDYLDKGDCIFIGGKTFVVTYQEKDFYSNDSHNLALYLKDEQQKNKLNQLFLASCIYKGLDYKYSWGDSISNRKIQSDVIQLPIKNSPPSEGLGEDYDYMALLISAIQKLVIKDVVLYADRKIEATKQVIEKN